MNYNDYYKECPKILSIIVPIRNESYYLRAVLDEFNLIEESDVELVVSDNYSDDGSWELLLNEKNSNIKLVRPQERCTPFDNWHNAISMAEGYYLYPIGGDDIFISSSLINILPLLRKKNNNIIIGHIQIFKDVTNEVLGTTNTQDEVEKLFDNGEFSILNNLSYINFDQMIFSFIPRKYQNYYMGLIDPMCYETFCLWLNWYNYYGCTLDEIHFVQDVVLMKRWYKRHDAGNFNRDQEYGVKKINIKKFKGTIKNSFNFMKVHFDLKVLIYFLFYNRQAIGTYGKKRIYSPFIHVVGSEVLSFARKYFV